MKTLYFICLLFLSCFFVVTIVLFIYYCFHHTYVSSHMFHNLTYLCLSIVVVVIVSTHCWLCTWSVHHGPFSCCMILVLERELAVALTLEPSLTATEESRVRCQEAIDQASMHSIPSSHDTPCHYISPSGVSFYDISSYDIPSNHFIHKTHII